MKQLFILAVLGLAAISARAQTTTNFTYRIQLEVVTAGVTNTTSTNWRYDYGTKKDATRIDGINFAYGVYVASLDTNTTALAIGPWLKRQHQVLIDAYGQQKQQADNTALLAKITWILNGNADVLSAAQLSQLDAIATLAP